ncbi:MAG: WYL domain-containing transcriptional regulator [Lachnospiraceae bacterium]|nr:WYL domain-containing transcriptional regulator [Lachnospiraceae bacterium]
MPYSELIKNFSRVRDYMREFYVYGFKSRDEYTKKSARSYDDEKRRMESLLGDRMRFRRTAEGKNVFLSIDTRVSRRNPLYKAWKAKSFTDGDITLHFLLLDLLASEKSGLSVPEITDRLSGVFPDSARVFDESTVRKKLKEYEAEGLVRTEKSGKSLLYSLSCPNDLAPCADMLGFFSEVSPCGVIGSFLLDKTDAGEGSFAFKHHYITGALDSGIAAELFAAMREKRSVILENANRKNDSVAKIVAVPLKIMCSAQSGRQYLMAFVPRFRRITSFRLDNILSVTAGEECERFDEYRAALAGMRKNMWGISTQSRGGDRLEHVEFTVRYGKNEPYIRQRLEREKRCGTVEDIDGNTAKFSADVFDASEMIPWIRTFLCRITEIHFSDPDTEKRFLDDLHAMYGLYGLGEEADGNAVQ